jgi:hypothetical protein
VTRTEDSDGRIFRILPSNPKSAPIEIVFEEGGQVFYVTIGKDIDVEIPTRGGRHTDCDGLDELWAFLEPATQGKVHEQVWFSGNEIVRSRTVIEVLGRDIKTGGRVVFVNPFSTKVKRIFDYEAYRSGGG